MDEKQLSKSFKVYLIDHCNRFETVFVCVVHFDPRYTIVFRRDSSRVTDIYCTPHKKKNVVVI